MRRVFGVVVLLAGTATTTGLGMLASRLADTQQPTAVRAIMVHGALVDDAVLVTDAELATALHDEVARAQQNDPLYPKELLMQRPCLTMAVFLPTSTTAAVPAPALRPEQADLRLYYYPALDNEPAVIGRALVSRARLDALSGYGIPVQVRRDATPSCAQLAAAVAGDATR